MAEAKSPPQGLTPELLAPIDIEDTLPVSIISSFNVLTSDNDRQTSFVSWGAVRNLSMGRSIVGESEQNEASTGRDALDDVISLSPRFEDSTVYHLARDTVKNLEHWLGTLGYSELATDARDLGEQLAETRLADCEAQVSGINDLIAEDPELHVLLLSKQALDSEQKYRMAKLKGMAVNAVSDEPVPQLIVAGESNTHGFIPDQYSPFGLYVSEK